VSGDLAAPATVRVLVVDDDVAVASLHQAYVGTVEGFACVGVVHRGADALRAVEALSPDLVLLDVHLPDRSGIEVLRALRAEGNDVGVVMVTAAREADTVRAAAAGGAAHYLVKPFEFDDLATRLAAFRQSWLALRELGTPDQDDIDAVFAPLGRGRTALPKGLSTETAEAVRAALGTAEDLSAAECAETIGVSRVSARRYLEHFVAEGSATVRLRYGGAGRPERRYSSA
jgi:response regulator of citrate/malate metabolism